MKATTPRWIAFGIICLLAIVNLLTNMGQENLIGTLVLLVVLFIGILVGKEKTVISTAPAIVIGWLLFGGTIGNPQSLDLDRIMDTFAGIVEHWGETPTVIFGAAAVIAAQIFLRNSDKKVLILVRYAALAFLFMSSASGMLSQFLLLIALLGLSFELRTSGTDCVRKPRILSCIYLWLLACLTWNLYGNGIYSILLGEGNTFSIYVIIGIGVLGGLAIMEKASDTGIYYLDAFKNVGPILLFWCGTTLMTLLMTSLSNLNVLVLVPVVMFHLYHIFIKEWKKIYYSSKETLLFYLIWSLVCVLSLTLSKSIYLGNTLTSLFLAVAPIAAVICWNLSKNKHHETETMVGFLGVCAVIALAVSSSIDTSDPLLLATFILTVALLCVFWCLLSGKLYKLDRNASKVDKEEFKTLAKLQKFAPLVVIVIALFKILLANPGA